MFKCPICRSESEIMNHANGKLKLTCGKKECKIVWNHSKIYRRLKEDFHCPYCKETRFIFKVENRQYCTKFDCKRKHETVERKRNKVLTLDELPIEDLKKDFPTFYGLVKINKTKIFKCLKCYQPFESTASHRICSNCTRKNENIGALAYG